MKKIGLLGILMVFVLLAGCNDAQKNDQLIACQQEKAMLQAQLDQANDSIGKKDQQIEKLKGDVREVNQKALESIRTMMERQNAKDVELKNKLKAKEAEAKELQQKLDAMQASTGTASEM